MPLIVILIILLGTFGSGGYYMGPGIGYYCGGGLSLVLALIADHESGLMVKILGFAGEFHLSLEGPGSFLVPERAIVPDESVVCRSPVVGP